MYYPLASRNTGRRASHSREKGMLQLRQCRSERCRISINPVIYACLARGHFDQGSPLRKCQGFDSLARGPGTHCSGSSLQHSPASSLLASHSSAFAASQLGFIQVLLGHNIYPIYRSNRQRDKIFGEGIVYRVPYEQENVLEYQLADDQRNRNYTQTFADSKFFHTITTHFSSSFAAMNSTPSTQAVRNTL